MFKQRLCCVADHTHTTFCYVCTVRLAWFVCIAVDRSFWQDEEQEALNRILPDMAHMLFYFAYLILVVYW